MNHQFGCRKSEPYEARDGCESCQKNEAATSSPCSRCGQMVTNGAFFKKTSPHFKLTCKRPTFYPEKIPVQSWKSKMPFPMPRMPSYRDRYYFDGEARQWADMDLEAFCKYWGIKTVGDGEPEVWTFNAPTLPEGEGRWIKTLFAGKCSSCGQGMERGERGFYYRESRALLCAGESCGRRAAAARYGRAA